MVEVMIGGTPGKDSTQDTVKFMNRQLNYARELGNSSDMLTKFVSKKSGLCLETTEKHAENYLIFESAVKILW